jgi:hypothetical protein
MIRKLARDLRDKVSVEEDDSGSGGEGVVQWFGLEEIFVGWYACGWRLYLDLPDGPFGVEDAGGNRSIVSLPPGKERT